MYGYVITISVKVLHFAQRPVHAVCDSILPYPLNYCFGNLKIIYQICSVTSILTVLFTVVLSDLMSLHIDEMSFPGFPLDA